MIIQLLQAVSRNRIYFREDFGVNSRNRCAAPPEVHLV